MAESIPRPTPIAAIRLAMATCAFNSCPALTAPVAAPETEAVAAELTDATAPVLVKFALVTTETEV